MWGVHTVLIATYNLHNLFLGSAGWQKPNNEVRPLARMIDQVGADILAVQEVGSAQSLAGLNERLASPYAHVYFVAGNSNRSIHLGFLSKTPLVLTSHRQRLLLDPNNQQLYFYHDEAQMLAEQLSPLVFFRDALQAEVEVAPGVRMAFFGVHLKSKTNPAWQMHSANTLRLAECAALAQIINEYLDKYPNAYTCVLGDCNDSYASDALAPLRAVGLVDPLGCVLRAAGRNPSTYWPKRRTRIDHILVSHKLAEKVVPMSPQIHINHMARTASDHYPVSLDVAFEN